MLSVIFALFYYSVAAIPIYGMNAFQAIRRSIRLAVRRPFTAFFLAALILFIPMVLSQINDPVQIVDKFRPELVYWLMVIGLFIEMIASFFWMSTSVRFLLDSAPESTA